MCQSTECKNDVFACYNCGFEHKLPSVIKGCCRTRCSVCREKMPGYVEWMRQKTGFFCECGNKKNRRSQKCYECFHPNSGRYSCDKLTTVAIIDALCGFVLTDREVANSLGVAKTLVYNCRKRYIVCLGCGAKTRGLMCQSCGQKFAHVRSRIRRTGATVSRILCCKECCSFFTTIKSNSRFCSKRCGERYSERNRRHWQRQKTLNRNGVSFAQLFEQSPNCEVCGVRMVLPSSAWNENAATIDHIIPLSKGGLHTQDNVRCVCHLCNSIKGDRDLSDQRVSDLRRMKTQNRGGLDSAIVAGA